MILSRCYYLVSIKSDATVTLSIEDPDPKNPDGKGRFSEKKSSFLLQICFYEASLLDQIKMTEN